MAKVITALVLQLVSLIGFSQLILPDSLDSVSIAASDKYSDPSFLKKLLLGKNYRQEWETPVNLPVFNIKEHGLKIEELGGGQQTKSLQLKDRQGREWVLRTVDKDVEKALPKFLRHTIAQRVTQDMVSAAHPYAPLTIPSLARAIGVVVPSPTFYFVPDDPALEPYRSVFANSVCMLEQKEPTPDNTDTDNTSKVLEKLTKENDHLVMQQVVLKARLLDMLVADWDRHEDQWRWAEVDSGRVAYYYAIPRDRDQAYFYSQGLLVKAARLFGMKHLVGFRDDLDKLKRLNYKSWTFDAIFLNELDREQWASSIKSVQALLSDEVIANAVKKLPAEIYPLSGAIIESKLRGRRDALLEAGLKYYDYLARFPIVSGTNEVEIFKVSGNEDSLLVQVFDQKDGKEGRKLYERAFTRKETRQISMNGFGGADRFIVVEDAVSDIKLKFDGGEGTDYYDIRGEVKNTIYDRTADNNKVASRSKSKVKIR